jgi:hypothetical protein
VDADLEAGEEPGARPMNARECKRVYLCHIAAYKAILADRQIKGQVSYGEQAFWSWMLGEQGREVLKKQIAGEPVDIPPEFKGFVTMVYRELTPDLLDHPDRGQKIGQIMGPIMEEILSVVD